MTTTAPTAPAPTTAPVPVAPPPTDPSPVTTTAPTARLGAAAGSAGSGAGCRVAAVREPPGGLRLPPDRTPAACLPGNGRHQPARSNSAPSALTSLPWPCPCSWW